MLINTEIAPVIMATVILIFAIMFVSYRKKKERLKIREKNPPASDHSAAHRKPRDTDVQDHVKLPVSHEAPSLKADPKVEEIRIQRTDQMKKTTYVSPDQEIPSKIIPRKSKKKREFDWFEGTDDMRYKIDKLTGEIDEEKFDKWFEGTDNIQLKIDEALNKKKKKKKEQA